jgi:hypothetical protein
MGKRTPTGKTMENAKTAEPLDPKAGSPGQRSKLHAATAIQSSIGPEDYPKADRKEQVAGGTGRGSSGRKR